MIRHFTKQGIETTPPRNRAWLQSIPVAAALAGAVALAAGQTDHPKETDASAQAQAPVSASVVWKPDAAALKAIDKCGGADPQKYTRCFVDSMRDHGASPEALALTQELAASGSRGPGYTTDFTEGGKVAVARVVFPEANSSSDRLSQAWLLVNGSPGIVDVDDHALLPESSMQGDLILQEIRRTYPKAGIYGDERAEASPAMMLRPDGGQSFPITYTLHNGCRSCEEVGNAEIAFDFSPDGKFQGATLLGLWMRKDMGTLVAVQAGRDFYLHMPSNHSAGYAWQLVSPLDGKLLKFVAKDYSEPGGQFGKDGIEKWTLHALAPGRTILRFENLKAGETNPTADRKFFFAVTVQ